MDFELTEEQKMLKTMVRDLATKELEPVAAEVDEQSLYPAENVQKLADLGLIGLPLGLMVKARARSWGIALSVVVFTGYYILLSSADSLGETGTVNPVLAMWIPDMVLGVATVGLFWWAVRHS